jgi:hypothetical protein
MYFIQVGGTCPYSVTRETERQENREFEGNPGKVSDTLSQKQNENTKDWGWLKL